MINSLIIPKDQIVCIPESFSCKEAVEILEDNNLRCAPVVDATCTLYRGNLYRYHIYQHFYRHPEEDLSQLKVTPFLKNTTKVVHKDDSLFKLIFTMADLPYITVLNETNSFVGIIQHGQMLQFLSQAWAFNQAGWLLQVETLGNKGELNRLSKFLNRYCDISACTTFEKTDFDTVSICAFVLPDYVDSLTLNNLVRDLNRKNYPTQFFKIK